MCNNDIYIYISFCSANNSINSKVYKSSRKFIKNIEINFSLYCI